MGVGLARIPQVNGLALDADDLVLAPVARDDGAIQDHVRQPFLPGPLQRLGQLGAWPASTAITSSTYR